MDPLTAMKIITCKDESYQTYLVYKELNANNNVPPKKTFLEVARPLGLKNLVGLYARVIRLHDLRYTRRLKNYTYTFSSLNGYDRENVLSKILYEFVCSQTKQERHPSIMVELHTKTFRTPHLIQGLGIDKWIYRIQMDIRHGFVLREKMLLIVNRLNRKIVGTLSKCKGKKKYLEILIVPPKEQVELKEGEKIW